MHGHNLRPLRLCLAALAAAVAGPAVAQATEPWAFAPGETVAGQSQAEWSRAWWQWAGSFERNDSPVADRTGELCGRKQSGPVWFLAGTYGTRRTERTCTVPRDKILFFPLINYVVMRPAGRPVSCMAVMSSAASMTDQVSSLIVDLDGKRLSGLEGFRQPTSCFDMGALAEPRTTVYPSAANGYYVMLKPLPPGTHTLNFGGVLPDMVQAVTYTLKVE